MMTSTTGLKVPKESLSPFARGFAYLGPILTCACIILYYSIPYAVLGQIGLLSVLVNLGFLAAHNAAIKKELIPTTKIERILGQYSVLLKAIEDKNFQSERLNQLQAQLNSDGTRASKAINELGVLLGV